MTEPAWSIVFQVAWSVTAVGSLIYMVTTHGILGLVVTMIVFGLLTYILYTTLWAPGVTSSTKSAATKPGGASATGGGGASATSEGGGASATTSGGALATKLSEVFYVASNIFTYEEAPAVCAAYGAKLATYDQVDSAYGDGAEWCGYGWTQGGMALFPTQEATWKAQAAALKPGQVPKCGRPGVNGGYFDPKSKFGVNCFGPKPRMTALDAKMMAAEENPQDSGDSAFNQLVNRIKDGLGTLRVAGFDHKDWSQYGALDITAPKNPFAGATNAADAGAPGLLSKAGSSLDAAAKSLGALRS